MGGQGSRLGTISDERLRADVAVQLHLSQKGQGGNAGKKNRDVLLKAFSSVDSNQDGTLSYEEFCRVAEDAGIVRDHGVAKEVKLREAFARFDRDHNGWVEFDEVMDFMCPMEGLDFGTPSPHGPEEGTLRLGSTVGRASPKRFTRRPAAKSSPKSTARSKPRAKRKALPKGGSRPPSTQSSVVDAEEPDLVFPTKSPTAHAEAVGKVASTVFGAEQKLKAAFHEFDADGSGKLDAEEFHMALKKFGLPAEKDSVLKLFRAVSDDGEKMSCESFCEALSSMEPAAAASASTRQGNARGGGRSSSSESDAASSSGASLFSSESDGGAERPARAQRSRQGVKRAGERFALEERGTPASLEDSVAVGAYPAAAKTKAKAKGNSSAPVGIAPAPSSRRAGHWPAVETQHATGEFMEVESREPRPPPTRAPKGTAASSELDGASSVAGAPSPKQGKARRSSNPAEEEPLSPTLGKSAPAGKRRPAKASGAISKVPGDDGDDLSWPQGPRLVTAPKPKTKASTAATEDAAAAPAPAVAKKVLASPKAPPPTQPAIVHYDSTSSPRNLIAAELGREVKDPHESSSSRPKADRHLLGPMARGRKAPSDDDSDGGAPWGTSRPPESEEPEEEPDENQASSFIAAARPFELPGQRGDEQDRAKARGLTHPSTQRLQRDASSGATRTSSSGLQAETAPGSPGKPHRAPAATTRDKPGALSTADDHGAGSAKQGVKSIDAARTHRHHTADDSVSPTGSTVPFRGASYQGQHDASSRKAHASSVPSAKPKNGVAQLAPQRHDDESPPKSVGVDFQAASASRAQYGQLPLERQKSQQQQQQQHTRDSSSPTAKPHVGIEKTYGSEPHQPRRPTKADDDEARDHAAKTRTESGRMAVEEAPALEPEPVPNPSEHQTQASDDKTSGLSSDAKMHTEGVGMAEAAAGVMVPEAAAEKAAHESQAQAQLDAEENRRQLIEEEKAREAAWLQADAADRKRKQEARAKAAGTQSQGTWTYSRAKASAKRAPSPPAKPKTSMPVRATRATASEDALSKTLPAKPKAKAAEPQEKPAPLSRSLPSDLRGQLQQQQQPQQQQPFTRQNSTTGDAAKIQRANSCRDDPSELGHGGVQAHSATSAVDGADQRQPAARERPAPSRSTSGREAVPKAGNGKGRPSAAPGRTGLTNADVEMLAELSKRLADRGLTAAQLLAQCSQGATGQGRMPAKVDSHAVGAFTRQLQYVMPQEKVDAFVRRAHSSLADSATSGNASPVASKACDEGAGGATCTLKTADFLALLEVSGETRIAASAGDGGAAPAPSSRYLPETGAASQPLAAQHTRRAPDRKKRRLKRRLQALSVQENALAAQLQGILFGPRSTMESVFRSLDTNKDGAVSCEDFLIALEHSGIAICDGSGHNLPDTAVSGDEVADMLAFFDRDGDGLLKYEEFMKFLESAGHQMEAASPTSAEDASGSDEGMSSEGSSQEEPEEEEEDADDMEGNPTQRDTVAFRRRGQVSLPLRKVRRKPPRRSQTEISVNMSKGRNYLPSHYSGTPQESVHFVRMSLGVTKRGRALGDMDKVATAFEKWDHDGDGTISEAELFRVLNMLDSRFTEDAARRLFTAADANRDGVIDYQEFIAWLFQKSY